jgi:hypothetical protein
MYVLLAGLVGEVFLLSVCFQTDAKTIPNYKLQLHPSDAAIPI